MVIAHLTVRRTEIQRPVVQFLNLHQDPALGVEASVFTRDGNFHGSHSHLATSQDYSVGVD